MIFVWAGFGFAEDSLWVLLKDGNEVGAVSASELQTSVVGTVVAINDMASSLNCEVSAVKDGIVISYNNKGLRVVDKAAAMWLGYNIVSTPTKTFVKDGKLWVEQGTALSAMNSLLKLGGDNSTLAWGGLAQSKVVAEVMELTEETVEEVKSSVAAETAALPVKPENAQVVRPSGPASSAAPKAQVKSDLPSLKGMRWGNHDDKIRVVLDLDCDLTPKTGNMVGKLFVKVSEIDSKVFASVKDSKDPIVRLEVTNGAEAELAFYFPDREASCFQLKEPHRYIIDIPKKPTVSPSKTNTSSAPPVVPNAVSNTVSNKQPSKSEQNKAEIKVETLPDIRLDIKPEVKPETVKPVTAVSSNESKPKSTAKNEPITPKALVIKEPTKKRSKYLVVVDAGHGGKDPGATRGKTQEKVVALQIAKRVERELKARNMDVRMTRSDDTYLQLRERSNIANVEQADAFISIHLNSLPKGRRAQGVEIFIMSPYTSDKDILALAKIENTEFAEDGSSFDADPRNETLLSIFGKMQETYKIEESTLLAESIYNAGISSNINMRRVAQAPFAVLKGAFMPAVLVETGFMTDPNELKMLTSEWYQKKLAKIIVDGVEDFFKKHEKKD